MKKIVMSFLACGLLGGGLSAQNSYSYEVGGMMLSNDAMSTADLFSLSQNNFNFATARSMAMGGAFTSLGADQASMSINPAGLGMYRHGEVTITPMLTFSQAKTSQVGSYESNSKNRFALGNVGAVFNLSEGTGLLTSLNIGVAYNRLADYNYNYSFRFAGGSSSIADALSVQLEGAGAKVGSAGISLGNRSNWDLDPFLWNGVAAYKGYLVDYDSEGYWYPSEIGSNATIDGGATVRSIGSAGEFDIAMGANLSNKFYVGFTIGIQSIYQKKSLYYGEGYSYGGGNGYGYGYGTGTPAVNGDGAGLNSVMQSIGLSQTTIVEGTGANFKLGMVYQPFQGLRLAAAIHTPTYYSVERRYQTALATASLGPTDASKSDFRPHEYTSEQVSPVLEDKGNYSWNFITPTRVLFGASYTLGKVAILSVDYERSWYNGIRVKGMPTTFVQGEADFAQDFKHYFKGSNTLRAGLEVRPLPAVALRVGYGYNGSMLKDEEVILSSPVVKSSTYYTAGVGFSFGPVFLDFAYCYQQNKMTPYMLYYGNRYDLSDATGASDEIHTSAVYSTSIDRHNVAMTLGFRF